MMCETVFNPGPSKAIKVFRAKMSPWVKIMNYIPSPDHFKNMVQIIMVISNHHEVCSPGHTLIPNPTECDSAALTVISLSLALSRLDDSLFLYLTDRIHYWY